MTESKLDIQEKKARDVTASGTRAKTTSSRRRRRRYGRRSVIS
jgi:hypothetical protein